jgi:hypothetical protein
MIEALVGILFAAFFVTVYFIISLLRRRRTEVDGANWSELYPPALRGANPVEAKPKLFRTTDEMSRHHLPAAAAGATPPKMMKAPTDGPGQPGERA